jgi:hypothetical protein
MKIPANGGIFCLGDRGSRQPRIPLQSLAWGVEVASRSHQRLGLRSAESMAGQDDTIDLEAKQRAGEHLTAALHHLGWEQGAGATIWARAITDELARLEDARKRFETDTADLEAWERLHSSALLLVVSIDQVLVFGAALVVSPGTPSCRRRAPPSRPAARRGGATRHRDPSRC